MLGALSSLEVNLKLNDEVVAKTEEKAVNILIREAGVFALRYRDGKKIKRGEEIELILDNKSYQLPAEVYKYWQDGNYAIMAYPLITIEDTEKKRDHLVYHLEEEKVIIRGSEILKELAEKWEYITGEEPLYVMEFKIEPREFNDGLTARLSPDQNKLFVSVQHYMIATMRTVLAVVDLEKEEISFLPEVIERQLSDVFWSPSGDKFGFITGDARGFFSLYIVDTGKLEIIAYFPDYRVSEDYYLF